jgi:hypothetical protein
MGIRPLCGRVCIAVFSLGLMTSTHSSAEQPRTGQINGHVVDSEGAAVQGAVVFVHGRALPEEILKPTAHTDYYGSFTLALPAGGYDILIVSPGFVARVETVPVSPGKTKRVQWKLDPLRCDYPGMNCDEFR